MKDTFTVAIITDNGYFETCHPLAIGVDSATAKSIYRHFNPLCNWNDYSQTGEYVMVVSRTYCTNHEDYEKETTLEDVFDEDDIFEPSAEDLREWQMASCGLC